MNFCAASSSLWTAWCFVTLTIGANSSPLATSRFAYRALRLSLAMPLALAISGFFFFVPALLPVSRDTSYSLELALSLVATVWCLRRHKANALVKENALPPEIEYSMVDDTTAQTPNSQLLSRAKLALWLLSVWSVAVALLYASQIPEGGLDSWPIWNLHARFLYYGGAAWNAYLSPVLSWTHPDYPLFLPLLVARGWSVCGGETAWVPILISILFGTATASLLTTSLIFLRHSFFAGFAALTMLIGTPIFLLYSTVQCADVPLGFFFLATLVCVTFGRENASEPLPAGYFVLAGTMASLAAWTKNEGLLFVVILVVAQLLCGTRRQIKRTMRQIAFFVLGALPFLFLCWWFKHAFAPPTDLVSGQGASTFAKLIDRARFRKTAWAFIVGSGSFGDWILPPAFLLGVYGVVMKTQRHRANQSVSLIFLVLALVAVGYFLVYMTTPRDLSWHLRTSMSRLLLQLWPTFLFAFFLWMRTPDDALNEAFVETSKSETSSTRSVERSASAAN